MTRGQLLPIVMVTLALLLTGVVSGQDEDYLLTITLPATGLVDATVTATVTVDNSEGEELAGYKWGVCHDEDFISIAEDDVVNGDSVSDLEALNDGDGFFFHQVNYFDEGWQVAALMDFGGTVIAPDTYDEMYLVTYGLIDVTDDEGTPELETTIVEYCETLDVPEPEVRFILVGDEAEPVVENAEITILAAPTCPILAAGSATLTVGSSGNTVESADVVITLDTDCEGDEGELIGALSFGLEHDGDKLTLVEITAGSDVDAFDDDEGAAFLATNTDPDNGPGGTYAMVVSLDEPFESFDAQVNEVAHFIYDAGDSVADGDQVSIDFSGALGDPPVAVALSIEGDTFDPGTVSGLVTVEESDIVTNVFLRGDANGNGAVHITDVFFALAFLFEDGDEPDCRAAVDFDDDERTNIADVLATLAFLFEDGDPPGDYPDCESQEPEPKDEISCLNDHDGCL